MRKVGKYLLVFLCLPLLWPGKVQGDTTDDINQQSSAIQTQQTQLNNQLNTQMAQVSTQTVKTNELQTDILKTQKMIDNAQKNLITQKSLLKTRRKYAAQRLSAIQRQDSNQSLVTLIAGSTSLTDMFQRVYAIRSIQKADDLAIKNVATTYAGLKEVRKTLNHQQDTLLKKQAQLAQQNQELQQNLTSLKQTIATNETQLAQLAQQKEANEKAQQAQAQAATTQATPAASNSTPTPTPATDNTPQTNAIFNTGGVTPTPESGGSQIATGVKISFYDPAVLGSSMGYNGVAANLAVYPKGTRLKIVFADGTEIHRVVNDTGTFVYSSPNQIDVAWPNAAIPSYGITTATVTVE